jgi:hypothetical protein
MLPGCVFCRYFGILLLPKGPEDGWLLRGLAGWLEGLALRTLLGSNELQYRRWQVQAAVREYELHYEGAFVSSSCRGMRLLPLGEHFYRELSPALHGRASDMQQAFTLCCFSVLAMYIAVNMPAAAAAAGTCGTFAS